MFAKPECDNVLQPELRRLGKFDTENNVLSSLLYTFLSTTPGLNGNEALCYCVLMGMKPVASDCMVNSHVKR